MKYLGVHVSIAGGVYRMFDRALRLDVNTVQIFLKNASRWKSKDYSEDEIRLFFEKRMESPDLQIFAHSGYLINLAGDQSVLEKSIESMTNEIKLAETLKIEYIVIHPGSHKGKGEDAGISQIAQSLDIAFENTADSGVSILLETTAGQGTSIGCRFEHLRDIIAQSRFPDRLGVCLDTCHIYAAGYDFTTPDKSQAVIDQFQTIVGIDRLKLIHLNDSKKELSSRVDRHEHIGDGHIGDSAFKNLLKAKEIEQVPIVLETPKSNEVDDDLTNLERVKKILS